MSFPAQLDKPPIVSLRKKNAELVDGCDDPPLSLKRMDEYDDPPVSYL